jgi:hypothetical protein
MYNLADLFWLSLLLAACYYAWHAHGMKEIALRATRKYCSEMDIGLLDDTVVLRGFWWKRDGAGRLRMWRSFLFEFTATGAERYRGKIVLLGNQVQNIELEPHRLV